MKTRALLMCGVALCAAATVQASGLRGTYASIEVGASWVENEDLLRALFPTVGLSAATTFQSEYDTGWAILGSVGYGFADHLRAELEVGYRSNDIDRLFSSAAAASPNGDLSEFTLMANLIYDLRLNDRLSLSIGGGVGADRAQLDASAFNLDEDDWVVAYQGLLGVNYAIADQTQLFLNYRYLHADAPDFTNVVTGPNAVQRVGYLGDLDKHAVTVGLRFWLEGGRAEPPAPPPAPPAPPPPQQTGPIPQQFIVFFGFDRTDLTPEAVRVVGDAADAAARTGAAAIAITGHTDSSGSPQYNQALSQKRASVVRAELIRLGVAAANISASGHGEDELIVRTADGVKEPQNRRATIDLH